MPANYVLLEKITVGAAGASSVTFSSIPQTGYTDLVVKASTRSTRATADNDGIGLQLNSSTSGYTYKNIGGTGSSIVNLNTSYEQTFVGYTSNNLNTANTFGNAEIYIPNYTGSTAKSYSSDTVSENNATGALMSLQATLQSSTSAITSLTLFAQNGNLMQYSTFYLYGVAKLGTTPAIVPYATGGDTIMTDGTYWYHTFLSSGTFTPAKGLSCDVLLVAGGGGGAGTDSYAGGGAGGLLGLTSQSLSATNYTVTIGGGGAGSNSGSTAASNGSNSSLGALTAAVGGGGAGGGWTGSGNGPNGSSGGSGGGGGGSWTAGGATTQRTGGTGTSGQGSAGGNGSPNTAVLANVAGGGGGGAGAVGTAGSAGGTGGSGGAGLNTYSSWATATSTGVSGYYAGGGGSAGQTAFGSPGAGNGGAVAGGTPTAPTANTGGGGNGSGSVSGSAGASGIVIVRYAV